MATYSSVTTFDFDDDGTPTSVPGTRTQEFDEHGNLVHDRSTIDLDGDSTPDFVDESRFTHDPNNVVTQVVTERHGTENSGFAKLIAATDSVYTNAYNGQLTLLVDINADGAVDKHFTAQNTFDQNNRPVTVVEADTNGDGKIDYRALVTNDHDALGKLVGEHQAIDRDANGAPDFLYTATHTFDPATGELISSKFAYDLNGDGTPDIETVVALTDQTTQNTGQTNTGQTNTGQTNTGQTTPPDWLKNSEIYSSLLEQHVDGDPERWSWKELTNAGAQTGAGGGGFRDQVKTMADYAKSGYKFPDLANPGTDLGPAAIDVNNLLTEKNLPEWFKEANSSGVDPKVIAEFAKSHPFAEIPPVTEAPPDPFAEGPPAPAAPAQATDLAHADMLFM